MNGQLSISDIYPKLTPRPLLIKEDSLDGWIYICPNCKTYICGGKQCFKCGQELGLEMKATPYKGKYQY